MNHKIESSSVSLEIIAAASPLGMLLIDDNENLVYANSAAEKLFGNRLPKSSTYRCGEFISCGNADKSPDGCGYSSNCPDCHLLRSIRSILHAKIEKEENGEAELIRSSGFDRIWVKYTAKALNVENQKYVLLSIDDITDQKMAEKKIAETLSWYQAIFEGSNDAIFISDEDARLISVNNAACRLTGYCVNELLSMKISDLHEDVDLDAFNKDHTRIMKGEPLNAVAGILRKDGKKVDTEFSNKRIAAANRYFMHTTARDISERKHWEEAIRKSVEKHRSILQTAMDGFVMTDIHGKIFEVNEAYCRMLGYSENELLDLCVMDLVVDESFEKISEHMQKIADHGHDRFESRHRRKDGSVVDVEVSAMYQNLEKAFFVSFVRDITEKKKQEYELQLHSLVLDQIHDHVTVTDLDGVISYVNHVTEKSIGRSRHDLIGKTTDIYGDDPARGATQKEIIEKTLREGSWRGEVVNFNADGSERIMDCRTSVVFNQSGKPIALCGVASDITEYKRFHEKQEKLQKQLASAMEIARLGHWEYDVKSDLFTFNDQFYHIFRTTVEQVGGYSMSSSEYARRFVHPEDRLMVSEEVRKSIKTSDPNFSRLLEHRMLYADGEVGYINVRYFIIKDTDNRTVKTYGVNQDITYQKQVEKTLRESEVKFRSLVEQAAEMLFLHDLEGNLIDVNLAAVKSTGYSREELKQMSVFDIDPDAHDRNDMQTYWKALKIGAPPVIFEARHQRKDGSNYPAEITVSKVVLEDGDYVLGLARDITKELEMKKRLAQSQRMEAIGTLAGGIAHDFNNILFPIVGLSEMLIDDLPPGSIEHENVVEIYNAGRRGSDLVKQILAFSRQSEQKKMPIRIQQILREVMKLSRSTIPSNISITQNIQNDCSLVQADPTQIHQIAMNLMTNAYHAVESKSGEISVRLREVEVGSGQPPESDFLPGRYAMLSVSDTGVGIDPGIKDKIFEPYFTTKEQGKGTGLGLAVVYGIVKEHHGDIKVRSELGKGTTFDIYLPVMAQAKKVTSIEEKTGFASGHERILLVDDEETIAGLEKQMLQRLGYKVTMRVNSLDALDVFKSDPNSFDLVISDMTMPNMTGDRLARELIAIRPDISIIICTGFSERINEVKAENIGIKGFLMKPIVKSVMAETVRKVLDEAKSDNQG